MMRSMNPFCIYLHVPEPSCLNPQSSILFDLAQSSVSQPIKALNKVTYQSPQMPASKAALLSMNKAELLAELQELGRSKKDSWSVQDLRDLLKEERGQKEQETSVFNNIDKKTQDELLQLCLNMHLKVNEEMSKAELLVTLRSFVVNESTGQLIMSIGKHKGMTFKDIWEEDPDYLLWAKKEVEKSNHSHLMLQALAAWTQRMEAKCDPLGPKYQSKTTPPPFPSSHSSASWTQVSVEDYAEDDKRIKELEEEIQALKERSTNRNATR